jgi:hypothetical protein
MRSTLLQPGLDGMANIAHFWKYTPALQALRLHVSETEPTFPDPCATMQCMPLYFFNFSSPLTSKARPFKNEGLELDDHAAAWEEATTACGEKLRELDGSLRPGDGWKMEVTDANGKAIFALRFTTESSE